MKLSAQGILVDRISWPRVAWALIALVMFWHLTYVTFGTFRKDYVIGSDAAGYYAYLPSTFIYHDPEYKFCFPGEEKVNYPGADFGLFMNITTNGKFINKYFIGTAVLEMPFFLIAYGTAPLFGHHMNGYSLPFQIAVALAAVFYVLLGLDQLRKLLAKMGVSELAQTITLLLVFFGTNLYQYTLGEPGMSHAFSFSMMAVFLNQAHNVFQGRDKKSILRMIVALSLVIMIRPVNGVAVFALPVIAGSWKSFADGIRFCFQHYGRVAIGVGILALLVFLQLLTYKRTAGDWFADSYTGEHLILTQPHIPEVLFSWKKGWFIYTPLMFVALFGIVFMKNMFTRIAFLLAMFVAVYVVSCWELWWYGGSFGMRPMIEYYPLMAIPLALLVEKTFRKFWLALSVPLFGFLLVMSLVQHYQYITGIIPYYGMTEKKYWTLFFKTSADYQLIYDPGTMKQHKLPIASDKVSHFVRSFEEDPNDVSLSWWGITHENFVSGKTATTLNRDVKESAGITRTLRQAFPDSTQIANGWVLVRAKVFLGQNTAKCKMAVSIYDGPKTYYWTARPLNIHIDTLWKWQTFRYAVKIPADASPNTIVSAYMFHDDESLAFADDMELIFFVKPKRKQTQE